MFDEIKRRLENGEKVCLECVDRDELIKGKYREANSRILARESLIVKSVSRYTRSVFLEECLNQRTLDYILPEELKYFKIKELEPTFDDLIDAAVQAGKDGVLTGVRIDFDGVRCLRIRHKKYTDQVFDQHDDYSENIEHIKSLYTETFVIESVEDIARLKRKAKVELANGNTFIVDTVSDNYLIPTCSFDKLTLLVLKGATVTQRGSKKQSTKCLR